ncbi:MAG: secretin and TonB N-terminal domain-containing protein, partial [Methylococcales bacterium]
MLHRILRPHASHVQPSVFITMLLFALFLGGTANGADEKAIAFDLPAQPMSASLNHIARSSGTKLIYADASVQGLEAPPLKGRYTVQQALDKVLNDQGLRYEVVDNTLIAVKPKESTNTTALPKVTVSGEAGYDSTDPYNPDYNRPNASTATRTDTPIMETPVSIQVVPQQVLKDQQAIQLQQVVQN